MAAAAPLIAQGTHPGSDREVTARLESDLIG
jgi:hypothetical protein